MPQLDQQSEFVAGISGPQLEEKELIISRCPPGLREVFDVAYDNDEPAVLNASAV